MLLIPWRAHLGHVPGFRGRDVSANPRVRERLGIWGVISAQMQVRSTWVQAEEDDPPDRLHGRAQPQEGMPAPRVYEMVARSAGAQGDTSGGRVGVVQVISLVLHPDLERTDQWPSRLSGKSRGPVLWVRRVAVLS